MSAFFLSTWLYKVAKETYLLTDKLLIFGAPAVVALVCIVAIAYAGNYQRHQRFGNKYTAFALIVISSAVAVAATFLPQQPTSDQFFTEEQFESYRKLGYHSLM
ncbi:hypothetical protein [Dyadobacter fanqingshengii]|uniref:Uncharacterized protein n=1 Tax=Dyadobacter fanqingshengii TaxID=2906443 RepID=A0A9X1P9Z3_9BACT|nr:hypothetical protein [Dyadobacter fanqingshengii]MCF0039803.1 hypothetical protein [Dyadobacter fanqingshengii]USJ38434.1 hypothetical protein NFI81_11765 [Dyadobacter fanqingshengii]